ncbi:OmpA family protein [Flavihumibacter petaseus]|uniref:OmpA family protein n=1 Tax=Flavihumibacter petaseus NBRC 106054 TaxID=1220578 RepID=A0A0E9MZA1_9BACT|nr:OmpA family protein [Flavihumibacter petaseus]GAO43067.1 OmpA family protein [Flavihumibacter petaseus NBRC 106054]
MSLMKKSTSWLVAGMLCTAPFLFSCGTSKKLKAAQEENAQLQSTISSLNADKEKLTADLAKANSATEQANSTLASYRSECEATKAKLAAGQAIIDDYRQRQEAVNKKLEEALTDFNDKGVDVYLKDNQVYISMGTSLLYKTGSAQLSPAGKEALKTVAAAVNDYPDLKMIVVGHTDTMHVKGVADNWGLSTERANVVVRELVKDGVTPARLTAAGQGKFNPIAANDTKEGMASNRRTEIILLPNLEKLWDSSKQ